MNFSITCFGKITGKSHTREVVGKKTCVIENRRDHAKRKGWKFRKLNNQLSWKQESDNCIWIISQL